MTSTIGPMANSFRRTSSANGLDELGVGRAGLADEPSVELAGQEGRGLGALEGDPHDVRRPPAPLASEE